MIPEDINWIVKRARERGYPIPSAFMSSKPDAGINHKTYGVTSEGVQVFLDVALREMNMHPSQRQQQIAAAAAGASSSASSAAASEEDSGEQGSSQRPYFTVKMTGGPDGDVAGNMIKILHREYGEQGCRIVGLADGTVSHYYLSAAIRHAV